MWLPPQGGDGRRWEILYALALVSPGARSLSELLVRMGPALRQHASLVIVTPDAGSDWVEALVPLLRKGVVPTVLLLDPVSYAGVGIAGLCPLRLGVLGDVPVAQAGAARRRAVAKLKVRRWPSECV